MGNANLVKSRHFIRNRRISPFLRNCTLRSNMVHLSSNNTDRHYGRRLFQHEYGILGLARCDDRADRPRGRHYTARCRLVYPGCIRLPDLLHLCRQHLYSARSVCGFLGALASASAAACEGKIGQQESSDQRRYGHRQNRCRNRDHRQRRGERARAGIGTRLVRTLIR